MRDTREAYDAVYWRLNAEELRRVAEELRTTLPVLEKYDMQLAADSVRNRIASLEASALRDILHAVELER